MLIELKIEDLTAELHTPLAFAEICKELSAGLEFDFTLDKECLLLALSGVESSYARMNVSRNEPSYSPGGIYFSGKLKELYRLYGSPISASYGPWQIMAIKARELGYLGHPLRLWHGLVSGPYVVKLLNQIAASGAEKMDQVLDAYNTGSFRVGHPPKEYIEKFWRCYERAVETKLK